MSQFDNLTAGNLNIVLSRLKCLIAINDGYGSIDSVVMRLEHGLTVACNVDKGTIELLEDLLLRTTTNLTPVTDKALLKKYLDCEYSIFVNTDWDEDPQIDGYNNGEIHACFTTCDEVFIIPRSCIIPDDRIVNAVLQWNSGIVGLVAGMEGMGTLIGCNERIFQRTSVGKARMYRDIDNGEVWVG